MKSKSKIINTKDMSAEERMEALRKVTKKFNKKMGLEASVKRDETSFMDKFAGDDNIYAWTDAPKYCEEHYGDRMREQKEYESTEGWN